MIFVRLAGARHYVQYGTCHHIRGCHRAEPPANAYSETHSGVNMVVEPLTRQCNAPVVGLVRCHGHESRWVPLCYYRAPFSRSRRPDEGSKNLLKNSLSGLVAYCTRRRRPKKLNQNLSKMASRQTHGSKKSRNSTIDEICDFGIVMQCRYFRHVPLIRAASRRRFDNLVFQVRAHYARH